MQLQFNAQTVPPSQPMEPVPDGWYPNIIKSTEPQKVQGSETKWLVKLEHEIIDGPFKGRKVYNNLNLGNDNQVAVDIAYRDLSAMCHVTGRFVIADTNELCNIPFQIKVAVEGSNNRIKGYKDMAGNDPGKTGAVAGGGQPAASYPPAAPPAAGPPAGQWGAQPPQGGQQWGNAAPPPAGPPTNAAPQPWGGNSGQAAPPAAPPANNGGQQWQPAAGGAPAGTAPWQR